MTTAAAPAPPSSWEGRRAVKLTFAAVWLGVIGAALAPFAWNLRHEPPPRELPVLAQLPAFQLLDQDGKPFGTRELDGKVWLASFLYTRCETICPAITAKMRRVQDEIEPLGPRMRLVSISVDPDYDTPARLAVYAKEHGAAPGRWSFLTGPEQTVKDTVVNGLKVMMEKQQKEDGRLEGIFHGSHLVLVDGQGRIRGYYDTDDEFVVEHAVRDARLLVNRG
ncbi:SCO family protein [Anaeromyxobacter paludicola]|uniref:Lipoprotein n=1 Tax=Anaeromyxobacter paludicola TaxID=2918171 RepID=A0ABN6N5N0_9BACT|nr:SCO family protein [Anaeromyxobacter paludicola]BDG08471.1 lipoprotein [Anaeromyxobacter paludicola]